MRLKHGLLRRACAAAVGLVTVAFLLRPGSWAWFGSCPLASRFGLPCPSCKLSSALDHAVHLEFVRATQAHTLGVPVALLLIATLATSVVVVLTGHLPAMASRAAARLAGPFTLAWLIAWLIQVVPQ